MESAPRRATRRARWIVPALATSALIGLGVPSLLQAQQAPAAAPHQPAANQRLPSPPNPAAPAPQVAATPTPPPTPAAAEALQLGRAFSEVAERVLPSVVSIRVEAESDEDNGMMGGGGGLFPFMVPFGGDPRGRGGPAPLVRGSGSGVVIRQDGVILTNNHVVERARRISVHLRDGRVLRGRLLGADPAVDLALVKVDAQNLPSARLGDSDQARVGEWVLAVGAPMGLEATVTHGVVSATGRAGFGAAEIEDYLQTDASINPGNSGGPLVNLRGEVLGINTMIIGRNTGIGMAVPSRIAQSVVEQILRTGRVARGWIGVGVQELTSELAQGMNVGTARGALINMVEPNAPAARAGIQVGDVVTAIDGRPLADEHDLVRMVTRRGVGDRLALTVVRDGHPRTITVATAPRPGARTETGNAAPEPTSDGRGRPSQGLGLQLQALPPELAARLGAPPNSVAVAGVEPGGVADEAGLRRGDVILRADGREVHSAQDVRAAAQDKRVTLLVRRGNAQVFVPLAVD